MRYSKLVSAVSNCADAVRLETAPTGDESVHLFLESTIFESRLICGLNYRWHFIFSSNT